jgi:hypothetical protein
VIQHPSLALPDICAAAPVLEGHRGSLAPRRPDPAGPPKGKGPPWGGPFRRPRPATWFRACNASRCCA